MSEQSDTPMEGQSRGLMEAGAETLALCHGVQALVRTLSKDQRAEFGRHLRSLQPRRINSAYARIQSELIRASQ